MAQEFLVNINPAQGGQAEAIVKDLQDQGTLPKGKGATIYVGADSSIAVTQPPTARVEQVFRDGSGAVDTAKVTS